jgi:very-short-patch-repair endonuclease
MDNVPNARSLRQNATEAEQRLWNHLRGRRLGGYKFVRQKSVGPYIVDFACHSRKLVIELDGGQHDEKSRQDAVRTRYLESAGWHVLRFWNPDIMRDTEGVIAHIVGMLEIAGKG